MPERAHMWVELTHTDTGWMASCGDDGGEYACVYGSKHAGPDTALHALVPYLANLAQPDPISRVLAAAKDER